MSIPRRSFISFRLIRYSRVLVTAQTAYNLEKLAAMCGYKEQGRIIDKLVREK